MTKISVIIPVYNSEKNIKRAINSLQAQTFSDIEIIVIDDGSLDSSLKIIESIDDKRIRVFSQVNTGAAAARNVGIKKSRGKYVAFLDSDDYVAIDWLNNMYIKMKEYDADLVIGGYEKVFSRRFKKTKEYKKSEKVYINYKKNMDEIIRMTYFNPLWNKLYKKEIIDENNLCIPEVYRLGEDFLFNILYLESIKKIVNIDCCDYKYEVNNAGITHTWSDNKFDELMNLNDEYAKFLDKYNMDTKGTHLQKVRVHFSTYMDLFRNKDFSKYEKKEYIDKINKKNTLSKNIIDGSVFYYRILGNLILNNRVDSIYLISKVFKFIKFDILKD